MKPNVENKRMLQLKKQKVATLNANEMSQINAGNVEAAARTKASSKHDVTCCWCTQTISSPQA